MSNSQRLTEGDLRNLELLRGPGDVQRRRTVLNQARKAFSVVPMYPICNSNRTPRMRSAEAATVGGLLQPGRRLHLCAPRIITALLLILFHRYLIVNKRVFFFSLAIFGVLCSAIHYIHCIPYYTTTVCRIYDNDRTQVLTIDINS